MKHDGETYHAGTAAQSAGEKRACGRGAGASDAGSAADAAGTASVPVGALDAAALTAANETGTASAPADAPLAPGLQPGERMVCSGGIDTLDDPVFLARITRMSAWIAGVGVGAVALAFWLVPFAMGVPSPAEAVALPWWPLALVAVTVAALMAHEAVHGLFFKLFAPRATHVTFGFKLKQGMLYACAEGIVYTRGQYQVVAAAPAVAVTALLALVGAATGWWLMVALAAVFHLSGCAGDLAYVADMARSPEVRWCEDTPTGVKFYGVAAEDAACPGDPDVVGARSASRATYCNFEEGDA